MNTKDKNKELMFNVDKMISDDESLIVYSQDGIDFTRIDMLVLGKIKFLYIDGYINSEKKYNYLINLYKEYVKLKRELEGYWYSYEFLSDADYRIYNKKSSS